MWLWKLLEELGYRQVSATVLHEDNMGAIEVSIKESEVSWSDETH